jgi:hypothetical protein
MIKTGGLVPPVVDTYGVGAKVAATVPTPGATTGKVGKFVLPVPSPGMVVNGKGGAVAIGRLEPGTGVTPKPGGKVSDERGNWVSVLGGEVSTAWVEPGTAPSPRATGGYVTWTVGMAGDEVPPGAPTRYVGNGVTNGFPVTGLTVATCGMVGSNVPTVFDSNGVGGNVTDPMLIVGLFVTAGMVETGKTVVVAVKGGVVEVSMVTALGVFVTTWTGVTVVGSETIGAYLAGAFPVLGTGSGVAAGTGVTVWSCSFTGAGFDVSVVEVVVLGTPPFAGEKEGSDSFALVTAGLDFGALVALFGSASPRRTMNMGGGETLVDAISAAVLVAAFSLALALSDAGSSFDTIDGWSAATTGVSSAVVSVCVAPLPTSFSYLRGLSNISCSCCFRGTNSAFEVTVTSKALEWIVSWLPWSW